ncbi:MAG: helix-turn-helix domain-containing protein [Rubrivivax sp.]|jgi:AraC-like DNA-binding protein
MANTIDHHERVLHRQARGGRVGLQVSPPADETQSWSGEFAFFEAGALFRGKTADNRLHRHATVQLTIGLGGPVTMRMGGAASVLRSGRALVVRPEVPHALQPGPRVLLALLEPQTRLARQLLDAVGPSGVSELPISLLARIDTTGPLAGALDALRTAPDAGGPVDARLDIALRFMAEGSGPRLVERAAQACGLSVSRLRALARARLETPPARWLMLRRLHRASHSLASGSSLADAALAAGFADQAHMGRSMRRVFGVTPATVAAMVRSGCNGSSP